MGSKSDLPAMEKAETELKERGISCEVRVMSPTVSRTPSPTTPAMRAPVVCA